MRMNKLRLTTGQQGCALINQGAVPKDLDRTGVVTGLLESQDKAR